MQELIQIQTTEQGEPRVSGRDLHMFLDVATPYHIWFPRMVEYGFSEDTDFETMNKNVHRADGAVMPRVQHDHLMTIDMAKELCMIQRTEKGKQARQYFLQLERDWNSPEKVMARALKIANDTIRNLKVHVKEMQPKALFADAVSAAQNSILVNELAKIIKQNGVDIGQNRLFAWLRDNGYLIKTGSDKNMPTQRAMDMKLFEVKEGSYIDSKGANCITRTTKVTGKGQVYFVNKLLNA